MPSSTDTGSLAELCEGAETIDRLSRQLRLLDRHEYVATVRDLFGWNAGKISEDGEP